MSKKNEIYIRKAKEMSEKVSTLRRDIAGSFNNRESSLAVTKLQEAEHWLQELVKKFEED